MSNSVASPLTVDVWIAHYFSPGSSSQHYASQRASARFSRSLSLSRNLAGLLAMQRQACDPVLSPEAGGWLRAVDSIKNEGKDRNLRLAIHVCVLNEDYLQEALSPFLGEIELHRFQNILPKHLPSATRDALLRSRADANLSIYMEDDLVLHDQSCIEKWLWFAEQTNHQAILMPHRYERLQGGQRAYVDGPIKREYLQSLRWPVADQISAIFNGTDEVRFQHASNPHSGLFAITSVQKKHLRSIKSFPMDSFVGPLETAATATVAAHYPVYKPSWECRKFLDVEHAHPVFRSYLKTLPHFKTAAY